MTKVAEMESVESYCVPPLGYGCISAEYIVIPSRDVSGYYGDNSVCFKLKSGHPHRSR